MATDSFLVSTTKRSVVVSMWAEWMLVVTMQGSSPNWTLNSTSSQSLDVRYRKACQNLSVCVWSIALVRLEISNFIFAPLRRQNRNYPFTRTAQRNNKTFLSTACLMTIDDLHKDISSVIVVCSERFNDSNWPYTRMWWYLQELVKWPHALDSLGLGAARTT